jgi:hypothetical protein
MAGIDAIYGEMRQGSPTTAGNDVVIFTWGTTRAHGMKIDRSGAHIATQTAVAARFIGIGGR